MIEWSGEVGFGALFAASFLAATVLPANSEVVLLLVLKSHPGQATAAIAVATLGNTLGGLTTYGLGRLLPHRVRGEARAERWVRRHGAWALLLSWVPFIGDALVGVAGWLRVPLPGAAVAMAAGKLARYVVVAQAAALL